MNSLLLKNKSRIIDAIFEIAQSVTVFYSVN